MKDEDRPESTERHIAAGTAWEDSATFITTGTSDSFEAAWYLTKSRVWALAGKPGIGPVLLGVVVFLAIVAMVVLSPTTDSHFIYTDF